MGTTSQYYYCSRNSSYLLWSINDEIISNILSSEWLNNSTEKIHIRTLTKTDAPGNVLKLVLIAFNASACYIVDYIDEKMDCHSICDWQRFTLKQVMTSPSPTPRVHPSMFSIFNLHLPKYTGCLIYYHLIPDLGMGC